MRENGRGGIKWYVYKYRGLRMEYGLLRRMVVACLGNNFMTILTAGKGRSYKDEHRIASHRIRLSLRRPCKGDSSVMKAGTWHKRLPKYFFAGK